MKKYNPANERTKRTYFGYLKEAKRHSEPTVDAAAKALNRFEVYTKYRDFKKIVWRHREERRLRESIGWRQADCAPRLSMRLKRRLNGRRSWDADVCPSQCVAWSGDGSRLCSLAVYVDYYRARVDFMGQPRSVESDRPIFESGDGACAGADSPMDWLADGNGSVADHSILILTFLQFAVVQSLKDLALRMN